MTYNVFGGTLNLAQSNRRLLDAVLHRQPRPHLLRLPVHADDGAVGQRGLRVEQGLGPVAPSSVNCTVS